MSKIISLYGGPGSGKSTSAAWLFHALKVRGENAELVREYAKDWAWEGRTIGTYDQLYFLGKQIRKESMLFGKVSHIVTDSPVMLSVYYANAYSPEPIRKGVRAAVDAYYAQAKADGHEHRHVWLRRTKGYNPAGRYQTEAEARHIDNDLHLTLREMVPLIYCETSNEAMFDLLQTIG